MNASSLEGALSTALASKTFQEGLDRGELRYLRCVACDEPLPYGAHLCASCGSTRLSWAGGSGRARLLSYVIYHRSYVPEVAAPYAVAIVQLSEGPRLLAPLEMSEGVRFEAGADLRARIENGRLAFRRDDGR